MAELVYIKDISGNIRFSTPINEGSKRRFLLMQEDYITLLFSLSNPVYFKLGDYVDNELGIFELVDLYKPTYNTTTGAYDYELRLDAYYWKWKNKKFFYTPETTGREAAWNLTATLDTHLNVFLDNLKALGYKFRDLDFTWDIDSTVENTSKLVSYDNVNLIDALTQMAETWECEWWIENHKICFGRCEYSSPVDFKAGDLTDTENVNVNSMTRSDSQTTYATRIYAFGSTRNIPSSYRKELIFDVKEVNGRNISDTSRPLKNSYFPLSSKIENKVKLTFPENAAYVFENVPVNETNLADVVKKTNIGTLEKGNYEFNITHIKYSTIMSSGVRFNGIFRLWVSLNYTVNSTEETITLLNEQVNATAPVGTEEILEIKDKLVSFSLPSQASNCSIDVGVSVWYITSTSSAIINFLLKEEDIKYGDNGNSVSITFLTGANAGQTFQAIYNPTFLSGDNSNVIQLPEGVTASSGNQYTINNIISGKVPDNYFSKDDKEMTLNGVVQKRLMLPEGISYVDAYKYSPTGERINIGDERYDDPDNVGMPEEEATEEIVIFEDEYPQYNGTISSVSHDDKVDDNGKEYRIYNFKDTGLKNFTEDFRLDDEELHMIFQTGKLAGMDFAINIVESDSTGTTFEIVRNEDYGRFLPDDVLYPQTAHMEDGEEVPADTYILYGFDTAYISEQMLPDAEQNLLKKAKEYVKKSMIDPSTYDCEMDADFIYNKGNIRTYEVGAKVNLINKAFFPEGRQSRIIGFEWPLDIPYDHPIYTVGETASYSRIGEIESKLDSLTYKGQTYSGSAVGGGGMSVYVIGVNDKTIPSDRNVFSAKRVLQEIIAYAISKTKDDTALGLISFLNGINVTKGIVTDTITATELSSNIVKVLGKLTANNAAFSGNISSVDYAEKLLGWLITPAGDIDAKSLRLRDFLEVPELRYNRVSVITGEEWNAPGGGIIESVDEENSIVYLKLEPGEIAAVEVDDICKANFNNDTGFQTTYFRITEKLDNGSFKYVLRSGYTYHPQKAMHFVCYGNFTNAERQKSSYSTQNYIRFLKGVNNWEITKDMIAMQLGDLSNLKLFGMDMTGHSAYLNRIYMTGTIKQISNDGVTEVPVPAFKGEWKAGTYWYYDEVTHNGSTWICIESTTTQEPSDSSTDWLKVISKGEDGKPGSQGIPGKDGVDGKTSYFHIKYSPVENPTASQMTDTPNKYIGTYVDFVQASSNDPSKYTWARFEGNDGIPGTNGENGQTSYLHIKYSDDGKTFTANNGETPGVYMGVYVDFIQADSSVFSDYTWSKIKGEDGQDGQDGKDGKGVQSVDVLYYLSSSSTSLSGGSWSTNSPTWVDGKYIWSKTKVVYTDGSSIETNPACITGGKGSTGDDGRGILSIVEEYYLSTSSNSLVGGSWSTTPPTWENGKYIWTRSVITYTDSTSTTTNPICSTGSTGETGIGVKSVAEQYYQSTSYSIPTGGSWQTSVPAWQDGKYIWTRVVITYTNNTYTETDPVCVTGGKGPSGNDGVGISAVDVLFYLSTSSSSLEGGSWSTTSPAWEDGKYLWTKTKVTYTNGSTWESDPACITGSQGKTGLPGAMLRPRGVWKENTEYYNNETFIDTVIYKDQNWLCKITHTSTTNFDSTKWEDFHEFENVATNVLLAQNATIDVLGTSGIFVGNLEKTEGWMITGGAIKHNVTTVELTKGGQIALPETGGMTVGGKTFIEAGKIKTEFIDVETLEVTHLKGATGSFKRLVGVEIENEKEVEKCAIGFSPSEGKMYFEGDIQHQGTYEGADGTERSYRFLTADLWCRGEFGHYKMTKITVSANYSANFYVHVYGYGTDTSEHKYPESGRPIDCVVMEGSGDSVLRICESAMYKEITVVNNSNYPKRVIYNHPNSQTYSIEAWGFKTFITAEIQTSVAPYIVNNLFLPK
ncbi:MAG: Prophage endopeptidase tail [Bacteriophage sp.]|nr:MAG: Prophage endopeptidase tail [Bacteriophage sp.]